MPLSPAAGVIPVTVLPLLQPGVRHQSEDSDVRFWPLADLSGADLTPIWPWGHPQTVCFRPLADTRPSVNIHLHWLILLRLRFRAS